jgi:endogenous inhibitor of DNA gyrase (YacG/DUF329 family)
MSKRQIVHCFGRDGHLDTFAELLVDGRWLISRGIHEVTVVNDGRARVRRAAGQGRRIYEGVHQMIDRVCPVCGQPFQAKQRHRVTCSDKCRQRKHREGLAPKVNIESLLERWKKQVAAERQSRQRLEAAGVDLAGAAE